VALRTYCAGIATGVTGRPAFVAASGHTGEHEVDPADLPDLLLAEDQVRTFEFDDEAALEEGNPNAHRVLAGVTAGLGHDGKDVETVLSALAGNDPRALRLLAEVTQRLGVSEEAALLYHGFPPTDDPHR